MVRARPTTVYGGKNPLAPKFNPLEFEGIKNEAAEALLNLATGATPEVTQPLPAYKDKKLSSRKN